MIWNDFFSVIASNRSFLISSHMSIDGDCAGSELAVYWYLKSQGKDVVVYNHDALPSKFTFLKNSEELTNIKPDRTFDVLIVLDCSNPLRLGWDGMEKAASIIVNIDHHRDNVNFGNINMVNANAAATGEIIYDLLFSVKASIPPEVADALYTAILTDTGGFRFSNTNAKVLGICAVLCDRGASCSKIYEQVYASFPPSGLMLQARIWSTLTFHDNGRICSMEMPYSLIEELGATYGDSEGMSDYTIMARGVEVGMLIKYSDNQTHFSLRSTGRIDVGRIAKSIEGGGGHSSAAGCTMSIPFVQAKMRMLEILSKELG
jgi:bifunctional oligoribonuclease and PAP phosphatase NrnA